MAEAFSLAVWRWEAQDSGVSTFGGYVGGSGPGPPPVSEALLVSLVSLGWQECHPISALMFTLGPDSV